MAFSTTSSPTLPRISINNPSIATTLDGSSNLSSPNVGSPSSPLTPDKTLTTSVSRTFKNSMIQQKLVMLADPDFNSQEEVLSLEKYEEFQKRVHHVRYVSPREKDEQKTEVGKEVSSSPSARTSTSVFNEDIEELYFRDFPLKGKRKRPGEGMEALTPPLLDNATTLFFSECHRHTIPLNVCLGRSDVSEYDRNITAYEIGESIAVFCLSTKEIVVHHVSHVSTTVKAIYDQFAKISLDKDHIYHIYLVGGTGSPESMRLLHNIELAILVFFGKQGVVKEKFINPNEKFEKLFISVAFATSRKKFFFCRHD